MTLRNTDTPLCCNPRGRNGSIREALPAGKRARVISMATWRERRAWRREFRSLGIRQVEERERASIWHEEKLPEGGAYSLKIWKEGVSSKAPRPAAANDG
jgi:hypothetical protein